MTDTNSPLVSVISLVYQHVAFIEKAIESWLMQKTNFDFEIIIGEDNSTDGTRKIVFDYAKKYPDIIRVITSDSNVGMRENSVRAKKASRGKYIALCEGDDYWIDPLKLQKQVDFMEANPDFSLCFHDAIVLMDNKSRQPNYFCTKDQKEITTTEDVIKRWYIPTASMLMKRDHLIESPEWFKNVYNGDWATQLILSTKGKIKYIDDLMSVYRKNEGGLSGGVGKNVEFVNGKKIELLTNFNEFTDKKFDGLIKNRIIELKKDIKDYKDKRKSKLLFWLMHPKRFIKKHIS